MNSLLLGHQRKKLLIVDDHPIVRGGLAELLARELNVEVRMGADTVAGALKEVDAFRPHLVVVDMSLKDSSGIELITHIKDHYPDTKALVWSMFDESIFAERALRAGAMGYVSKKEPVERMVHAVRQVLQGNLCFSLQMTNRLLQRTRGGESVKADPIERLTNRELEVFQMFGNGIATKLIGRKLNLSPKTIEAHRENIKVKLDIRSSTELNCRAMQWVLEHG